MSLLLLLLRLLLPLLSVVSQDSILTAAVQDPLETTAYYDFQTSSLQQQLTYEPVEILFTVMFYNRVKTRGRTVDSNSLTHGASSR